MITVPDLLVFEPPQDLKSLKWCRWEWRFDEEKKKWKKPPYSHDNKPLLTNEPDSWCFYTDVAHYERKGYLLTKGSRICVIDLDGCRNPETGEIADWAWKIIEALRSYTEISPSGTGVHIIVYGEKPENSRSRFHLDGHEVEVYDSNRYITFTGNVVDFYFAIRNAQDWIEENVPTPTAAPKDLASDRDLALDVPELELSESEIVRKLSSFSYGEKFKKLYGGDWEKNYESQSEADQALCWYLAFMTKDEEKIKRIFRTSGLYRDKWDREDYSTRTINKALDSNPGLYIPSVSKQMVEDLSSLRLQIKWKKPSLAYVYGALLSMSHKHSGVDDEGILVFVASRDMKLISGLNMSGKNLSSLIRELQDLGLIRILEVGDKGVATSYLIYPKAYVLDNLSTILIDPTIFPPYPPNLCSMMWVQDARGIAYQKDLTPTQKLILELVHYNTFSVTELASILGMRKRDLNRRVLGALKGYLDIDKEGFVIPEKSIENVLENNFDKERFEAVQSEIEKERNKYRDKILLGPLRRLLEKAEADKLDRSIEVTS
jgi:hypothetical protein